MTYDAAACRHACRHICHEIVRPLARRYYASETLEIAVKDDTSIVSEADRDLERAIRDYLTREFPECGVIGEELEAQAPNARYVWTIDPIDGTEAFVAGLPLFGTLLALIDQTDAAARVPVLGAIYMPVQDWLVVGDGTETTLNGRRIDMRATRVSGRPRLLLGDLSELERKLSRARYENLLRLVPRFRSTHTWGDCYGHVAMLTGKAHARVDFDLGLDDIAPLEPIFRGAGGTVTTCDGLSLSQAMSGAGDLSERSLAFDTICAATRELHADIVSAVRNG